MWAADLVAVGLKAISARERPFERIDEADPLLGATVGSSFPSGHAATSAAGALVLALTVRRWIPFLVLLAAGIAFSRVYVGVHYPLDVLGGAIIGAAIAAGMGVATARVRALRMPSGGRRRSEAAPPPG